MAIIKQPLLSTKSLTQPSMTAIGLKQNDGSVVITNAEVTPALLYIVGSVIQPVITIDVNTSVDVLSSTFNIIAPTVTATSPTINSDTKFYLPLNSVTNGATTVNGALEVLDSGNTGHIVTQVGGAKLSTTSPKIGTTCLYLASESSDYLTVPDHANWAFGSGNWTIEYWVKTTNNDENYMFAQYTGAGDQWYQRHRTNKIDFYATCSNGNGYYYRETVAGSITPDGNWHHIAIVQNGGGATNCHIYIDGTVSDGTSGGTGTTHDDVASVLSIGNQIEADGDDFVGYLDEVRISNTARYTANFTPSATAFTSDANTLLLLHMDTQDLSSLGGNTPHIPDFIGTAQLVADTIYCKNGEFDWWTSVNQPAHGWTINASVTATQEVGGGPNGENALKLVAVSTERGASNPIYPNIAFANQTVTFSCYVKTSTAGTVRIRTNGGDGIVVSAYHSGSGEWERLTVTDTANATGGLTTYLSFNLITGTAYFTGMQIDLGDTALTYSKKFLSPYADTEAVTVGIFDGNSDYITIPDSADWDLITNNTTSYTYATWAKHVSVSGQQYYFVQYNNDANNFSIFYKADTTNHIVFQYQSGGGGLEANMSSAGGEGNTTDWYWIALCIVANGTTKNIGIYKGTTPGETATQIAYLQTTNTSAGISAPFKIGGDPNAGNYFNGYMGHPYLQASNIFNASPNVGLTDTIVVPTEPYSV